MFFTSKLTWQMSKSYIIWFTICQMSQVCDNGPLRLCTPFLIMCMVSRENNTFSTHPLRDKVLHKKKDTFTNQHHNLLLCNCPMARRGHKRLMRVLWLTCTSLLSHNGDTGSPSTGIGGLWRHSVLCTHKHMQCTQWMEPVLWSPPQFHWPSRRSEVLIPIH